MDLDNFINANSPTRVKDFMRIYNALYKDKYDYKITGKSHCFLIWSKKSIPMSEHINIDWSELFNCDPYLKFIPNINGHMRPHIACLERDQDFFKWDNRTSKKYFKLDRNPKYKRFLDDNNITNDGIDKILNFQNLYLRQIELSIQEFERIDLNIQSSLKVFYYEAYQQILQSNESKDKKNIKLDMLRDTIRNLYVGPIRHGSSFKYFSDHWLPKNEKWVPKPIHDSLHDALKMYIPIKSKIIDFINPLFKKLWYVETAKYYILIGEPIWVEPNLERASPGERTYRNKKEREMTEAGHKNDPIRLKYIEEAIKVVKEQKKPRAYYLTKTGALNSKLYRSVQLRIGNNGNARKWLNKYRNEILAFCVPDEDS